VRARAAAARLVGAAPGDIAITGSVSHGIATAALNLELPPGSRVLRVQDEFPSLCLPWDRLARQRGLVVEAVPRPADGDWTAALLEAIDRPGAAPLGVATLTPLHWCDGTPIDLDRVTPAVRRQGGAVVVDATQAVGVLPVDVGRWRPDFLAFPTYKWVLGPTAWPSFMPRRTASPACRWRRTASTCCGASPRRAPRAMTGASVTTRWRCPWRRPGWNWWNPGARRRWRRGCAG
jgi:selenocysteine lyase/cysteine desulfurase